MTDIAIKYVANPLTSFFKRLMKVVEAIGNARAAEQLYRMGYTKEARDIIMRARAERQE